MAKSQPIATSGYKFLPDLESLGYQPGGTYSLIVRQQPKQARLCSSKEKVDRRPIDPPPIVQIKVDGYEDNDDYLQNPYFVMYASLVPANSSDTAQISPRNLTGTLASSLYKLKDVDNTDGGFFVFSDISVRIEGQFRLKFSLFEIISQSAVPLATVYSDIFTVYPPKLFPGMAESTFLSRSFSDQGVRIRIRKEHRSKVRHNSEDSIESNPVKRKSIEEVSFPVQHRKVSSFPEYTTQLSSKRFPNEAGRSLSILSSNSESESKTSDNSPTLQGSVEAFKPLSVPREIEEIFKERRLEFWADQSEDISWRRPSFTKDEEQSFNTLFDSYLRERNIPHFSATCH
ncbi:hypothetical protein K7432_007217 [Basidiobolus ranarum]|uniref:Velvet domain-containing protein n=1 Tax=Basidiobolus ranarum TaxID=34480 RepID=A0ABR2WTX0_9FUNG